MAAQFPNESKGALGGGQEGYARAFQAAQAGGGQISPRSGVWLVPTPLITKMIERAGYNNQTFRSQFRTTPLAFASKIANYIRQNQIPQNQWPEVVNTVLRDPRMVQNLGSPSPRRQRSECARLDSEEGCATNEGCFWKPKSQQCSKYRYGRRVTGPNGQRYQPSKCAKHLTEQECYTDNECQPSANGCRYRSGFSPRARSKQLRFGAYSPQQLQYQRLSPRQEQQYGGGQFGGAQYAQYGSPNTNYGPSRSSPTNRR